MKKQILLLAFLVITTFSMAQVQPSFGFRGGVSSSGMRGDAVSSLKGLLDYTDGMVTTSDRLGFFAGPYINIPLSETVSIEPALYYTQKGYEMKGQFNLKGVEFLSANAKAQLTSQYIDIPLMLKADMDGFQFFAGPQVSYLMQSDLRTTAGVLGFNILNEKLNATQQFNRWDAAVSAGVGYKFSSGLNVMAAYDHGLSKVDANQNMNSYNRSFKIGLGMSF